MKKLLLIIAISLALFSSCKKENVDPIAHTKDSIVLISQDSIEASKIGITTAEYLQIKDILNSLAQDQIKNTSSTNITSPY